MTQQQVIPECEQPGHIDDFGNSLYFLFVEQCVADFLGSIQAGVRFQCDGITERAFTEHQLQHYGFIQ